MSSLHLIFNREGLTSCELLKTDDDKLVLLGDGVYCAGAKNPMSESALHLYILKDDFEARGLKAEKDSNFISYDQMVELCVNSAPIVSWHA